MIQRNFGPLTRNEHIRQALSAEQIPMLPFEIDVLHEQWEKFTQEQADLGHSMREAMTESSETWHDNAPAEAIMHASKALTGRALEVSRLIKYHSALDYPAGKQPVTIGSIVGIQFGRDPVVENYLLTSAVREMPDKIAAVLPTATDVITLKSPIGAAIFDLAESQAAEFEVNARRIGFTVVTVAHLGDIYTAD